MGGEDDPLKVGDLLYDKVPLYGFDQFLESVHPLKFVRRVFKISVCGNSSGFTEANARIGIW